MTIGPLKHPMDPDEAAKFTEYLRRKHMVIAEVMEVIKPHRPHITPALLNDHYLRGFTGSLLGRWMTDRTEWLKHCEDNEKRWPRPYEPTQNDLIALVLFGRYTNPKGEVSWHAAPDI